MKRLILFSALLLILCSFSGAKTFEGTWTFVGSTFNGKYDGPPKDYTLQRKYTADKYDAYLLEKGQKPEKFESGSYTLKGDTCYEIQTYSSQPSKLLNVRVKYSYILRHDSLILHAKLPSGYYEDDYWKKVK